MINCIISAVLETCRRSKHNISGPVRMTTDTETSVRASAHKQRTNVNKSETSFGRSHEGHFRRLLQLDHSLKKNQFFHGLSSSCDLARNTDARCHASHAPPLVRLNGSSSTHGVSRHCPERVNFSILPTTEEDV